MMPSPEQLSITIAAMLLIAVIARVIGQLIAGKPPRQRPVSEPQPSATDAGEQGPRPNLSADTAVRIAFVLLFAIGLTSQIAWMIEIVFA